jgi:hypothetical protein
MVEASVRIPILGWGSLRVAEWKGMEGGEGLMVKGFCIT